MMHVLARLQLDHLTEQQQAIRDHFQRGGSFLSMVIVLMVIALILFLTYVLSKRIANYEGTARRNDPFKLFYDLMNKAGISSQQRRLVEMIGRDLRLPHPAVLLLCPALFDRHSKAWQAQRTVKRPSQRSLEDDTLLQARSRLFPKGPVPPTG